MCSRDGCTCWPDRIRAVDWSACCRTHDIGYYRRQRARRQVDLDLLRCVASRSVWMGVLMYAGVRVVGWYFWANKKERQ